MKKQKRKYTKRSTKWTKADVEILNAPPECEHSFLETLEKLGEFIGQKGISSIDITSENGASVSLILTKPSK